MSRLSMLSLIAALVAPESSLAEDRLTHCFEKFGGGSGNHTHDLKVVLSNALKSHTCARPPDVVNLENMMDRCASFCDPVGIPILIGTENSGFNQGEMDEICTGGRAGDTEFNGLIHDPDLKAHCNDWSGALREIQIRMADFLAADRVFRYAQMDFQMKLSEKVQKVQQEMQSAKVVEEIELARADEKVTIVKEILKASLKDIMKTGLLNLDLSAHLNTLEEKADKLQKTMDEQLPNLLNFADKCNELILGTGTSKKYLLDICSVTGDACIEDEEAKHSGCCCGIVPAAGINDIGSAEYRRLRTYNRIDICASAYQDSQQSVEDMMSNLQKSPQGESILNDYQKSKTQYHSDFYSECSSRRLRETQDEDGASSGINVSRGTKQFRKLSEGPKYLTCSPPSRHTKPDEVRDELRVSFYNNDTVTSLCRDASWSHGDMVGTCATFCGVDAVPLLLGTTSYGVNQKAMDEICLSPDTSGRMYSEESVRKCHSQAQAFRHFKDRAANLVAKLQILESEQLLFDATSLKAVSGLKAELQARGAKTIDDTKASKRLDEVKKLLRAALSDILDTDSQVRRRLKGAARDVKEAAELLSKSMKSSLPQLKSFMEQCNVLYTGVGSGREYLLDFCSVSSQECIEDEEGAHAGCCCGYNPITSLGKVRTATTIPGNSGLASPQGAHIDNIDVNICGKAYVDSKVKVREIESEVKKINESAWENDLASKRTRYPAYYERCTESFICREVTSVTPSSTNCERTSAKDSEFCKLVMTAVDHSKHGCESDECRLYIEMVDTAKDIYMFNLVDLILMILPVITRIVDSCASCGPKNWKRTAWIASGTESLIFLADIGLQVATVAKSFNAAMDTSETLLESECLNEQGNFILVQFADQMKNIRYLGIIEILVSIASEVLASILTYMRMSGKHAGGDRMILFAIITQTLLVLLEFGLSVVEFSVFATEASDKADILKDSLNPNGNCVEGVCWCIGEVVREDVCHPGVSNAVASTISPLLILMIGVAIILPSAYRSN